MVLLQSDFPLWLRPATMNDAALLFRWRNDELTRRASINTEPVYWEEHVKWLTASLADRSKTLIVAELGTMPAGTVSIDRGDETEISWTVAPEMRGRRVGKTMLARSLPDGQVIARIKRENLASQKFAASVSFTLKIDDDLQEWIRAR